MTRGLVWNERRFGAKQGFRELSHVLVTTVWSTPQGGEPTCFRRRKDVRRRGM